MAKENCGWPKMDRGPEMGVMGFRWVWSLLDGFKELEVGVEGLR